MLKTNKNRKKNPIFSRQDNFLPKEGLDYFSLKVSIIQKIKYPICSHQDNFLPKYLMMFLVEVYKAIEKLTNDMHWPNKRNKS